jgi:hypothetical protein
MLPVPVTTNKSDRIAVAKALKIAKKNAANKAAAIQFKMASRRIKTTTGPNEVYNYHTPAGRFYHIAYIKDVRSAGVYRGQPSPAIALVQYAGVVLLEWQPLLHLMEQIDRPTMEWLSDVMRVCGCRPKGLYAVASGSLLGFKTPDMEGEREVGYHATV